MRTFVSATATLLAIFLAAVAVPGIWLERKIVQEQGFVELAAPLGRDAGFQQGLAEAAIGTIDTSAVPGFLMESVQPLLEDAVASLGALPGYPAAWEETLRKSHRLNFAGEGTPSASTASTLTLDVAPLVVLAAGEISRSTGIPLDPPEETLIDVGQPEQKVWIERLAAYAPAGYLLGAGAALALLLALASARRRWAVLAGAGTGALVLAAFWAFGVRTAAAAVVALDSGNGVANLFRNEFVAAAERDFLTWTWAAVVCGAVLLVAGVLAGLLARRTVPATR